MTFLRTYRGLKSENKCKSFDLFRFCFTFWNGAVEIRIIFQNIFRFLEHGATLDIDFEYNMVSSNYNFDSNFLFLL